MGGRFLELDERSGIYVDIGDKKATEKTSQALREGQTQIRKKLYMEENEGSAQGVQTTANAKSALNDIQRDISSEAYLGYSVQVLESLYIADENASDSSMSSDNRLVVAAAAAAAATANNIGTGIAKRPVPSSPSSAALLNSIAMMKAIGQVQGQRPTYQEQRPNQEKQHQQTPTPPTVTTSAYVDSVAMARALEQFPGVAPPAQRVAPTHHDQQLIQERLHQQTTTPLAMPPALSSYAYVNNFSGLARALEHFPGAAPLAQHVAPAKQQQNQQQPMSPPQPRYAKRGLDPVTMARVLELFPGTARAYSQGDPSLHTPGGRFTNMSSMRISEAGIGGGGGGYGPSFGEGRLTNMSLGSMFSVQSFRRLLESARSEHYRQADRGTIESTLSAEIRDLIQLSAPQLEQVDNLPMEDTELHVGREVDSFYGEMEDRVSELRFTDVSRWSAVGEAEYKPRLTDSTEPTIFSKTSSMDASMRSSTTEESVRSRPDCKRSKYNTHRHSGGDIASAELLLQLSASDATPSRPSAQKRESDGGEGGSLRKDA